jgi:hypothetical protein
MGNKGAGGPFAPLVVVVRGVMGEKEFNKFRGKAISVHSQSERCSHTTQQLTGYPVQPDAMLLDGTPAAAVSVHCMSTPQRMADIPAAAAAAGPQLSRTLASR